MIAMAMEDTHSLARGVVIDGRIARPERYQNLIPTGRWITAEVIESVLSVRNSTGTYMGAVTIRIEGQECATTKTFYDLRADGWMACDFMDRVLAAEKAAKARKKRSR
jgi:hypothetical protein